MKKYVSIICAIALAVSLTLTASALTGYGTNFPGYDEVVIPPGAAINQNVINEAIETGLPIEISGNVSLTVNALATIADAGEPIVFVAADGSFAIVIDPADIGPNARTINLNLDIDVVDGELRITPQTSGNFGFALTIQLPAAALEAAGVDLSQTVFANHYAKNGKALGSIRCTVENGIVSFKITGASYYELSNTEAELDGSGDPNPNSGVVIPVMAAGIAGILVIAALVAKKVRK
jgi:hypothetical protein